LTANNAGLITAADTLNNGMPPKLAVDICNATNKRKYPAECETVKICHSTLMLTLKALTDLQDKRLVTRIRKVIGPKHKL
jgi:hypothetical protein